MARLAINPKVLSWAIADSGSDVSAVAVATGRDMPVVQGWLAGTQPMYKGDLEKLAKHLGRPPQFFFLPTPPQQQQAAVNRRAALSDGNEATTQEIIAVRSIGRLQSISRWSVEHSVDPRSVAFPKIDSGPAAFAESVKSWLKWDTSAQIKATSKSAVFKMLRSAFEETGILVFLRDIGADNSRGFSLPDPFVPTVLVNAAFHLGSVRSYTLLHEVAHLARGDMSLHHDQDKVAERWCERFAAAFLLPSDSLSDYLSKGKVATLATDDLHRVALISNRYGASWESVAWRLVELGLAPSHLVDKVKSREPEDKGFNPQGDPRTTPIRRLDEYGREFSRLLLSAVNSNTISDLDARKYLHVDQAQMRQMAGLLSVGG